MLKTAGIQSHRQNFKSYSNNQCCFFCQSLFRRAPSSTTTSGGGGGGGDGKVGNTTNTASATATPNEDEAQQKREVVQMLLQRCREGLADRNRDEALASLLHAIRISEGEDAITRYLDAAKDRY